MKLIFLVTLLIATAIAADPTNTCGDKCGLCAFVPVTTNQGAVTENQYCTFCSNTDNTKGQCGTAVATVTDCSGTTLDGKCAGCVAGKALLTAKDNTLSCITFTQTQLPNCATATAIPAATGTDAKRLLVEAGETFKCISCLPEYILKAADGTCAVKITTKIENCATYSTLTKCASCVSGFVFDQVASTCAAAADKLVGCASKNANGCQSCDAAANYFSESIVSDKATPPTTSQLCKQYKGSGAKSGSFRNIIGVLVLALIAVFFM